MFRARRYRVLFVFAAVFVLTFFHFARSRDWSATVIETTPGGQSSETRPDTKPDYKPPVPPADGQSNKITPAVADNKVPETQPKIPDSPPVDQFKSPVGSSSGSKDDTASTGSGNTPEKGSSDSYKSAQADSKNPSAAAGTDSKTTQITQNGSQSDEEIDRGGAGRVSAKPSTSGDAVTHWKKFPEQFPIPADELIKLPKDQTKAIPKLQAKAKDESSSEKQERIQQLTAIKAEFKHAWQGYKKAAMGHDELKPISKGFDDPFNGWGATLVDSLDTLWIMDLKEEFSEAVDAVKKIDFTTSPRNDIPVFETVIRYLGGLLGAYDVSGQRYAVLLEKAEELAQILIGVFDTPNRMPFLYYNWHPDHVAKRHRASASAKLAEIGSLSLEFTRLAQLTKQDKYYDAIARITNELENLQDSSTIPGLWPTYINAQGCENYAGAPADVGVIPPPQQNSPVRELPTPVYKSHAVPTDFKSHAGLAARDAAVGLDQAGSAPYNYGSTQSGGSQSGNSNSGTALSGKAQSGDASFGIAQSGKAQSGNANSGTAQSGKTQTKAAQSTQDKCNGGLRLPSARRLNNYSMGGKADSTYEYLPKEYLLLGGANDQYKKMYQKAIDAARKNLVFQPMLKGHHDLRFLASTKPLELEKQSKLLPSDMNYEGTHLACFAGGMVAVGAKAFGVEADMDLASKLTDGCVWAYESTSSGMMPESFQLFPCPKDSSCEWDEERVKVESKNFGGLGSDKSAQPRNGDSAYAERVKMNSPQGPESTSAAVPIPMPGSMNPHDNDQLYKRDTFQVGKSAIPIAMPTGSPEKASNHENIRAPPNQALQPLQEDHTDQTVPHPAGMVKITSPEYLLRPEAIESVFIMFRLTGDDAWRKKGWKMFEAIIKHSKTETAHAAIKNVNTQKITQKDSMESFWLAETLKYFYLLFSDTDVVDLDKYVLNTEAHPFLRPV
ncbi:CAZyme family GH47 [Penicillium capsulatum]|uniref:alpha-1,2-Mannosidase n=1 Tax=Penicillium capsulatum TaxID=69766 RepID=A0A9W9LR23_9EURO|nr:CAZyme family GH47 [Penicillium capsulatum]KAJ6135407.1 CAZyme family GH47 [Penicillium capsulatum]